MTVESRACGAHPRTPVRVKKNFGGGGEVCMYVRTGVPGCGGRVRIFISMLVRLGGGGVRMSMLLR